MTDENKAVEDFLGELKSDAESDPLNTPEEDPFSSIEQEKKDVQSEVGETEVKEEKVEKPLPFHKDPKFQRRIEQEVSKRIAELKPTEESTQDSYFDEVINAFTEIVGNDTPQKTNALNALKNSLSNLDQRAAEKAFSRLESVRQEELAQEREYENKLTDGFEIIEEETGVNLYAPENKKQRIQFINFIEQIAPKENGEISELPDIGQAFKAFRFAYKPVTQAPRAKELASKSMEHSEGTVTQQKTSEKVTWDNVGEKIMEKLGM